MKVLTIVGTRPEIIRLSSVMKRLDRTVEHVLVHTGQNYDRGLNDVFFSDFDLRRPDHYLAVDTSSLGRVLGETLIKTEAVLLEERPDAVLVLGDTNSCLSAIIAKRMRIPVYHMEAGNRCFDENVPEESNRRIVDHVADFNLVYTEHARRNLLSEGLEPRRIALTGSPMLEVIDSARTKMAESTILEELNLRPGHYFLVSAHREENVDDPARLTALLACLDAVQQKWRHPVVVSTHPRTRKRLEALAGDSPASGVRWMDPFGFHDYNRLQVESACVLSDSGTISEESAILGFAAVTLRESIERPEALDAGSILMTGLSVDDVLRNISVAMSQASGQRGRIPSEYAITDCSLRTVNFILSTAHRSAVWSGLRPVARL